MKLSIVIRTYNEAKHVGALLKGIMEQDTNGFDREVIIVDSGSTDGTLQIAQCFPVKVVRIKKEEFSFGRSLNLGCAAATGDILVFVSGHCIPVARSWLRELVAPLGKDGIVYSYGGQIGNGESLFSECQIFAKYFPETSRIPQEGFYCNNANSALLKSIWASHPFDEELTGLEDMHLAKRLVGRGHKIGYVATAAVYHIHTETWAQVKRRFEREAIALQAIMPEVHLSFMDFVRYWFNAVSLDLTAAAKRRVMIDQMPEIAIYRFMQYWGAYRGNHLHRQISKRRKEAYYYPR